MKKTIQAILIVVIFITMVGIVGNYETHYKMDCLVIEQINGVTTVVDLTGNEWDFESTEFNIEDVVRVTFYTNGTDTNRYDDEIIKVKKIEKI